MSTIASFCDNDGDWRFWIDDDISPCYAALGSSFLPLGWLLFVGISYAIKLHRCQSKPQDGTALRWTVYLALFCTLLISLLPIFVVTVRSVSEVHDTPYSYEVLFSVVNAVSWLFAAYLLRLRSQARLEDYIRLASSSPATDNLWRPTLTPLSQWPLLVFWLFSALFATIQLRSLVRQREIVDEFHFNSFAGIYPLYLIALLAGAMSGYFEVTHAHQSASAAQQNPDDDETSIDLRQGYSGLKEVSLTNKPKEIAELNANWLNLLFFGFLGPLIALGFKRQLDFRDIDDLLPEFKVAHTSASFKQHFDIIKAEEQQKLRAKGITDPKQLNTPRVVAKTFWAMERWRIIFTGFVLRLITMALDFVGPLSLNLLVLYSQDSSTAWFAPDYFGYVVVLAAFAIQIVKSVCMQWYFFSMVKVGLRVRSAGISRIFYESIHMSTNSKDKITQGKIQNMMANDMFRLEFLFQFGMNVIIAPIQIITTMALLVVFLGWAGAMSSLAVLMFLFPIQGKLAKKLGLLTLAVIAQTDQRVGLITEMFQGIRIIKFQAWETPFLKIVEQYRIIELLMLWKAAALQAVSMMTVMVTPIIVTVVAFAVYVAAEDKPLDAASAFTALTLVDSLRVQMFLLPQAIQAIVEAKIACGRIGELIDQSHEVITPESDLDKSQIQAKERGEVRIVSTEFRRNPDLPEPTMTIKNLEFAPGTLTAVVGSVGAGKSFLVSSILGETYNSPIGSKQEPTCSVLFTTNDTRIAYVAQTAWITNATLRDNILFGAKFDQELYDETLKLCCLKADLKQFPAGDMTEIGERGINLSGGQKQRVSMARAVYRHRETDLYLFDDPLSALDAHVGRQIFKNCICGLLKDKTRILVTHQLGVTNQADSIIVVGSSHAERRDSMTSNPKVVRIHRAPSQGAANEIKSPLLENTGYQAQGQQDEGLSSKGKGVSSKVPLSSKGGLSSKGQDLSPKPILKRLLSKTENPMNSSASGAPGYDEEEDVRLFIQEIGTFEKLLESNGPFAHMYNMYRGEEAAVPAPADSEAAAGDKPDGFVADGGKLLRRESSSAAKDEEKQGEGGKLVEQEARDKGRVKTAIIMRYVRACTPTMIWLTIVMFLLINTFARLTDWWLSLWTSDTSADPDATYYVGIYVAFSVATVFVTLVGQLMVARMGIVAARGIHREMLARLIKAPMSFFDTTPLGRLVNRFSKDIDSVDKGLPRSIGSFLNIFSQMFSLFVVISVVTEYFVLAFIPLVAIFWWLAQYYRRTSRELKRLDSVTRSPIFSHFNESLDGLVTIRAYRAMGLFRNQHEKHINDNFQMYYMTNACNRWLAMRLDLIGALVFLFAAGFLMLIRERLTPGIIGLTIGYALQMSFRLNFLVIQSIEMEVNLNSVERTEEYAKIAQEGFSEVEGIETVEQIYGDAGAGKPSYGPLPPPPDWPSQGRLTFENVSMRYRDGTPLILKNLNLSIEAKERVGVVGRTGAGKSSLMLLLFRIVECCEGKIVLDGIDISKVKLRSARKVMSIIPQDPVLFTGTIRYNLDPFDEYSDDRLWESLTRVRLRRYVKKLPGQLQAEVSQGGENFSVGQRQLFCMARALLRQSRVLILDEATASVDVETDSLIQSMVREEFKECTVLTIAHRLDTIMDYNKVLVLDRGVKVEFGAPADLLTNPNGAFSSLVAQQKAAHNEQKTDNEEKAGDRTDA